MFWSHYLFNVYSYIQKTEFRAIQRYYFSSGEAAKMYVKTAAAYTDVGSYICTATESGESGSTATSSAATVTVTGKKYCKFH